MYPNNDIVLIFIYWILCDCSEFSPRVAAIWSFPILYYIMYQYSTKCNYAYTNINWLYFDYLCQWKILIIHQRVSAGQLRLVNFHWARVRLGPVPLASCGNGSGVNSPTAVSFTVLSQTPRRPSYFQNSIIAWAMLKYFGYWIAYKSEKAY